MCVLALIGVVSVLCSSIDLLPVEISCDSDIVCGLYPGHF